LRDADHPRGLTAPKLQLLHQARISSEEVHMAGRLSGKVAVVTGAAPRGDGVGNGMATAILFAREGAKVVLVNRSAERAETLMRQIRDDGGEATVFAGDVSKADITEEMAAFTMKTYGRLDILHNNVGIGTPGTPETVTLENWNNGGLIALRAWPR
jgi:NAD(P)-dependent dehydrogenase (short-subunit alcohol dehydrogenase family)